MTDLSRNPLKIRASLGPWRITMSTRILSQSLKPDFAGISYETPITDSSVAS